jgi:predicted O-linked N-acetylglucosamine transferase (SPINDLY family)
MAKKPLRPPHVFSAPNASGAAAPSVDMLMAQAQGLQQAGRLGDAERLYREVLRRQPRHADALHFLGLVAWQAGHPQAAADLIAQAVAIAPRDADALANLGLVLHALQRFDEALASLDRALALQPGAVAALNNRGNTLSALGRHDEALATFDRVRALRPEDLEAIYNRGNALHAAGRLAEALASFDDVIARRADIAQAHGNRGRVLQDLGRHVEALAAYERAAALAPGFVGALVGRGSARLALKRAAEALADFDAALAIDPGHAPAHYDRGSALLALHRPADALAAFDRCLALAPAHVDARINRGNALHALRRHEEAIADYDIALRADPALAGVVANRGAALLELRRYDEAAADFARVLELDAAYPYAIGKRLYARMMACDWGGLEELRAAVEQGLAAGRATILPFAYSAVGTTPEGLLRCARLFAEDQFPGRAPLVAAGRRHGHARIRLGYLCGEFRHQATAILATELFELHDKARFELVAFDNGWDDGSALRRRIEAAFDEIVDISQLSDDEAARAVAAREIDILVNLNGWFGLGRTGVFARRPAPVQVNYLGFPGTMGAPYMDFIVADDIVVPAGEEAAYAERVIRLPRCYQPNDRRRDIAKDAPTRAAAGLPDDAFVFACFNNTYKITPAVFAAWMRILRAVDGSVLWLLQDNAAAERNLAEAAQAAGVARERLCFAPRARLDEHLARHALADLFLDTLPYNAHTTASDALWAGLPVLSCRGTTFPGRVGASLLAAVGLEGELLVEDLAAYEMRAIALARDRAALARVRAALVGHRADASLWDTPGYARALERAFEQMMDAGMPGPGPRA